MLLVMITLCMLAQMECMICQNVHCEVLYMMVAVAFMLGVIWPCYSLLQKCMLLLTAGNCYNLPICHFYIFLYDFSLSIMSTCFGILIMPYLQGWNTCIFYMPCSECIKLMKWATCCNFVSSLFLSYHGAMFAWCFQLIHA